MKDIVADTLLGRASRKLPGWLQHAFVNNNAPKILYNLPMVSLRRQNWRAEKELYYVQKNEINGQLVLTPRLSEGTWMGGRNIKIENDFVNAIAQAQNLLPRSVKTLLAESQVHVKLGHTMSDINPVYKTQQCRGQDCVVNNVAGCYEIDNNAVCLTQGYISADTRSFVRKGKLEVVHTALHEFGHALEHIVFPQNRIAAAMDAGEVHYRDLVKAYREDVINLKGRTSTDLGTSLTYYLTKENSGSHEKESHAVSELFAELCAEMWKDNLVNMQKAFPNAYTVLGQIMDSLELLVEREPNVGHLIIAEDNIPVLTETYPQAHFDRH